MLIRQDDIGEQIRRHVGKAVRLTDGKVKICAEEASKELRNAVMFVLRGERHGRTYTVPLTGRTYKKTGARIRGSGRTYTASAPGEPPARRLGTLRQSWQTGTSYRTDAHGNFTATAYIYSDVPYARLLEEGTSRIARRPYRDRTVERARPRIERAVRRMTEER